ncbi:rhodanese-like domain-containing protein [Leptospira sp. 2 VSF19]|uniref:Rhodanese-like domain-containing protein n=1 Tax=Leptospira soteropolitanensis TaxID=2950025 RepID=A0AAW5V7K7_9LEPT|nr:rhodanese-like domain-containing protein [Leptospira soteropolitanensis]MCW7491383.1 rhodanese-like domain-containing protein [Leptospira soteropolitanensis]MCW7498968.1 rhodanese-like domain-containing protein [Leptospira soteropolitanensis]MCW7521440.1 rhodanese-like domain-containing protein [Leptospira soteropolitanensis]MCW7525071.1 rhodanese-like domain-containing protein [Leptospira soteropolitanensis]MCW7528939.1 rhodanese-like domain-containing protein [Leptospira soteropolitanensi
MNRIVLIVLVVVCVVFIVYKLKNSLGGNPSLLKEKIDAGALVVDVRTVAEFQSGHYPGAINIPVDQVSKRLDEFGDKNRSIIVYCASGGRSGSAKSFLESIGYSDVTNAGGLSNMPNP